MKKLLRGIALFLMLVAVAGTAAMLQHTIVALWKPLGLALAVAAALSLLLRGKASALCGIGHRGAAVAVLFVFIGAVAACTITTCNYCISQPGSQHSVEAEVAGKNVRISHPTRRVGRGRYVHDSSRKIYHYEYTLRLPDGNTLKRTTDAAGYTKLRIGMHRSVDLRVGCFGWPTMR